MYKRLVYAFLTEGELVAACTNVAFLEHITPDVFRVYHIYQYPQSYIKLSIV